MFLVSFLLASLVVIPCWWKTPPEEGNSIFRVKSIHMIEILRCRILLDLFWTEILTILAIMEHIQHFTYTSKTKSQLSRTRPRQTLDANLGDLTHGSPSPPRFRSSFKRFASLNLRKTWYTSKLSWKAPILFLYVHVRLDSSVKTYICDYNIRLTHASWQASSQKMHSNVLMFVELYVFKAWLTATFLGRLYWMCVGVFLLKTERTGTLVHRANN